MDQEKIISKLLAASTAKEAFGDLGSWKTSYTDMVKVIHPDRCSHPNAQAAVAALNGFKDEMENGRRFKDEAADATVLTDRCTFSGDPAILGRSLLNYKTLHGLIGPAADTLRKYLPEKAQLVNDDGMPSQLTFSMADRALPLSMVGTLPQDHTNWVLSRMLELSALLNRMGYAHCGINPDSVFVRPESHGIYLCSFYHLTKVGSKMSSASGRYANFYPAGTFDHKTATSDIDTELSKRTAAWLLGDRSGSGVKLKKTHNVDCINFLLRTHEDPAQCFKDYRDMLGRNFDTKKFHILNI